MVVLQDVLHIRRMGDKKGATRKVEPNDAAEARGVGDQLHRVLPPLPEVAGEGSGWPGRRGAS